MVETSDPKPACSGPIILFYVTKSVNRLVIQLVNCLPRHTSIRIRVICTTFIFIYWHDATKAPIIRHMPRDQQ